MLIKSPDPLPTFAYDKDVIFLAGGISNCPDWQSEIIKLIDIEKFDVINPRREGDLAKDGEDAKNQIIWEFVALKKATIVLFWFPEESLCPITLFEYGKELMRAAQNDITLLVGCHENYQRKFDLGVQTNLMMNYYNWNKYGPVLFCKEGWEHFTQAVKIISDGA
jgi:hypothetical protein